MKQEGGGRGRGPRKLYGTKPIYIDKAVNAVEGTDSLQIYDTDVGRPIWREARECMLSSLNEVDGGLADHVIQSALDAGKPLVIVDGFGGRKGYNLELIDTDTGPIRDLLRLTNWMACVKQEDGGDFDYAVAGQYTSKKHWQQISQDHWQRTDPVIYRREAERSYQRTERRPSGAAPGRWRGEQTGRRH
jgi:hypothetical protein